MATRFRALVLALLPFFLGNFASPASATDDGTYQVVFPLSRYGHQSVYDPARHWMIAVAGYHAGNRNDVWVLDLAGSPVWSQLAPVGLVPPVRTRHSLIYDPLRNRVILFGGSGDSTLSDVWTLTLSGVPTWSQLIPAGAGPSPRWGHSAVYDPIRDRMLVFGGSKGTTDYNEVWSLSLGASPTWTLLTVVGTPPAVRRHQSVVYDSGRDRLVMFGGYRQIPPSGFQKYNDVWVLTLSGTPTWTQLFPSGTAPDARDAHTAIYDPVQQQMLVLGGEQTSNPTLLWVLSLSGSATWSQPTPSGSTPAGRFLHTAVYDPDSSRMLVFGGFAQNQGNDVIRSDTWALSLGGSLVWTQLQPPGVPPVSRTDAMGVVDGTSRRMILFGGSTGLDYPNDLWQLALPTSGEPTWARLAPMGTPPVGRANGASALDLSRQRMVVFGGIAGSTRYNDVWALSLAGGTSWSAITAAGTPPSTRWGHTAVYDVVRDRLVVFGGYNGSSYLNDVNVLTFSGTPTWSTLSASGTPPTPRRETTAIYDPLRDRMLVFGGYGTAGYGNDVWSLSFSGTPTWSQLNPTGPLPGTRDQHAAVYDSYRDRMLVFGGHGASYNTLTDAWELLLGPLTWRQLAPVGASSIGQNQVAAYDSLADRVTIAGWETQLLQFPLTYLVVATPGAHGTMTPSGRVPVVAGTSQTFAFTPSACYHVAQVTVDGVPVGAPSNYTFDNVQAAHTLTVSFDIDIETIVASAEPYRGTITPSGEVGVNCGASQTFAICAATGFTIADVLVDGSSVGAVTSYTFANVTGAHTISATFAPRPIALEPFPATNGTVNTTAVSNGRLYVGGSFTQLGAPTGTVAVVDTAWGNVHTPCAGVVGNVSAVAADGQGGWFIGGSFTSVRGVARNNLAHILADGSVAGWNPNPNGSITSIAVSGTRVCVGGRFGGIAGEPWHPAFAVLDWETGALLLPVSVDPGGFPSVTSSVATTDRVYVGGMLTYVGTATGGWARIDSASALAVPPFAGLLNGSVQAAVPDGSGGWFIGGTFSTVRGQAHASVAHILSDGSVSAWDPNVVGSVSGTVYALALSGNVLYLGGSFSSVGGQTRNRGAAVDATTGAVLAWNPNADYTGYGLGSIKSLAVSGSVVYAAGEFKTIGGAPRAYLAALDATTGSATTWNPNPSSHVYTVTAASGAVYVGGAFTSVGGSARQYIAALDPATGSAQFWNPTANGAVRTILVTASTIYAGGDFTNIGGQARTRLAALNTSNGAALTWNPGADATVYCMAVSGGTLYAGGSFTTIGGSLRKSIAALDLSTGSAAAWNPRLDGTVWAVGVSGGAVYAGGGFKALAVTNRTYLAAIDLQTGTVTPWNPAPNTWPLAIAHGNGVVYIGSGNMTTIGGASRSNVAAVDTSTGIATAWNPSVASYVRALAVSNGIVYMGGDLTSVGGVSRSRLAAVDASTGLLTSWNPGANNTVYSLATGNGVVYAGGLFTTIGGQPRSQAGALYATSGVPTAWTPNPNNTVWALAVANDDVCLGGDFTLTNVAQRSNLAAIDLATGLVSYWNPGPNGAVKVLRCEGGNVYVGGAFTAIGGASRPYVAAVDSSSGLATAWNPAANSTVTALAIAGSVVYVGGSFTSIGGQSRTRLAALDAMTGQAIFWNPDPNGSSVSAVWPTAGGIYVGGDFTAISGVTRNRAAFVDSATGAAAAWNPNVATGAVYSLLGVGSTLYLGGSFSTVGGQSRMNLAAVDMTSGATLPWAPNPNGSVYALGASGPTLYVGGHFTNVAGRTLNRLGAVDAETGVAFPWHPDFDGDVNTITLLDPVVYAGGSFAMTAGITRRSLARFENQATTDVIVPGPAVGGLALAQNYPNPVRDRSVIPFVLSRDGIVTLRLFDVSGRTVRTLIDHKWMTAGRHESLLKVEALPNGVYFCRLECGGQAAARRFVLLGR